MKGKTNVQNESHYFDIEFCILGSINVFTKRKEFTSEHHISITNFADCLTTQKEELNLTNFKARKHCMCQNGSKHSTPINIVSVGK